MKVSTERIPESQVVMTIEIEDERLDKARDRAVRKLSPKAKVPGFRPGKAPEALVRRYFGEERILDEALDDLIPEVYREAVLADESIDPVARPQLIVETTEPLVVKATIPVRPTIELGDYRSVRVTPEEVTVDEQRVDDTVLALRRRSATHEPMERELRWRDIVRLEVEGTVEVEGAAPTLVDPSGRPLVASKQREPLVTKQEAEVQLIEDRDVLFPGFEEQLLGKKKGDEFSFDLDVPAEISDQKYAGKAVRFDVKILETKEEVLPEPDDEWAKSVGDGYDAIGALRDRIREDIQRAEEQARDARYQDQILGELVERATIDYPPVMVEAEVDSMLHDQFGHVQHEANFGEYLASMGRTEDQIRAEFRPIAEERLKRALVLGKIADTEEIAVTDEEVSAEVETMTAAAGPQADQLRQLFQGEEGRATLRRNLLTRKTLARLVEIATQDGAGAEPTAEKQRPRRAAKKTAAAVDTSGTAAEPETAAGSEGQAP